MHDPLIIAGYSIVSLVFVILLADVIIQWQYPRCRGFNYLLSRLVIRPISYFITSSILIILIEMNLNGSDPTKDFQFSRRLMPLCVWPALGLEVYALTQADQKALLMVRQFVILWRFCSNPQVISSFSAVDLARFSSPGTRLFGHYLTIAIVAMVASSLHALGFWKAAPSQPSLTGYILMGSGSFMTHLLLSIFPICLISRLLYPSPKSSWRTILVLAEDRRKWGFLYANMVSLCAAVASVLLLIWDDKRVFLMVS